MTLVTQPRRWIALAALLTGLCAGSVAAAPNKGPETTTPIRHLVVLFQENVSFDHYFATYPHALNPPGEPQFDPRPDTPSVNGLNASLLAPNNPNSVQPFRLDRSQFETADQDHNYTDEQRAYDSGLMDLFVEKVGRGAGPNGEPSGQVMGYYDGNTVTALWSYAQAFAMSDNSYSTTFGPSTPGALNLIMTCFSASIVSMGASCNALPPAGAANPRPTRRAGVVKVESEHCLPPHWSALRERHLPSSPCWDTVGASL